MVQINQRFHDTDLSSLICNAILSGPCHFTSIRSRLDMLHFLVLNCRAWIVQKQVALKFYSRQPPKVIYMLLIPDLLIGSIRNLSSGRWKNQTSCLVTITVSQVVSNQFMQSTMNLLYWFIHFVCRDTFCFAFTLFFLFVLCFERGSWISSHWLKLLHFKQLFYFTRKISYHRSRDAKIAKTSFVLLQR